MKISDAPQRKGQLRWVMVEHPTPIPNTEFSTSRQYPILQVAEYPSGEAALQWVDVPMALEP